MVADRVSKADGGAVLPYVPHQHVCRGQCRKRGLMFSANIDGKVNVWGLDLDHGYPYPMTTLGEDCGVIMPDPEGRYVIAAFDKDGDENWQVFAMPPTGGQLVELLVAEGEKFYPVDIRKTDAICTTPPRKAMRPF